MILKRNTESKPKSNQPRFRLIDNQNKVPIKLSILVNIVLLLTVLVAQTFLQPVIPLLHSLSIGTNQLVPKIWLLLLPFLSLLFNVIHIGSTHVFKLHLLIEKLYLWSNLVLQLILLMVTLRSIFVVI